MSSASVKVGSASASVGEGPRFGGVISATGLAVMGLVGVAFLGLFYEFFWAQNGFASQKAGDWSHAYMVPAISAYLLWQRREELSRVRAVTYWPGLLLVMLSIACYVFFLAGVPNHMGQGWSAILCVFGLVLLLCGPGVAKIAVLPIGYLLMGVTISEQVMNRITWPLQQIAAQGAYVLLTMLGVQVEIAGNQLTVIPTTGAPVPLNVAEACSGMRMVIAFIALGLAVALVAVKPWWQRVLLMVLGVPIAILMNVVRVAVLGIASLSNPDLATGGAHMFIGTLLLVPGFVIYMGLVWALKRAVVEKTEGSAEGGGGKKTTQSAVVRDRGPVRLGVLKSAPVIAAVAVMGFSGVMIPTVVGALGLYLRKLPIQPPGNVVVADVPKETARWIALGKDSQMSEEVVAELGTQNYLSRIYAQKIEGQEGVGKRVELHLAYYTGMIDTVPHVPDRCMVGAGWSITGTPTVVPIRLDAERWLPREDVVEEWKGQIFTARAGGERVVLPRKPQELAMRVTEFTGPGQTKKLFSGYFFIANGGHVPTAEDVRLLAFELKDDYAFYLKVQISSQDVASNEELSQLAGSLLDEMLPEIMRRVPDWIEVTAGRYPADNPRRLKGVDGSGGKK
ncbi:MAG: exosortase/archaeosortase family protein [Phycisphaerales bacterium]|nr:exosortase/archaeosortase family protein [Phycisphaerales bacterium]